MRALLADLSSPVRAALTAVGSRLSGRVAWGPGGVLSLTDLPDPQLPTADGWLRVRPTLSGISASDLKMLQFGFSPLLTAYARNTIAIPGHEIVGVVEETGVGAGDIEVGDRVAIEPLTGCFAKGLPICRRCAAGDLQLCERSHVPGLGDPSWGQGFGTRLSGGWSNAVIVHQSQCYPLDGVSDERGVLASATAIALHAAGQWQRGAGDDGIAVVIGNDLNALLTVAALRRLHPDLDITVIDKIATMDPLPLALGATRVLPNSPERVLEAVASQLGATLLHARVGRLPLLDRGVDLVVDCVGSAATMDLAVRLLRARGTVVLLGEADHQDMDWTLVWFRELTIRGSFLYSNEPILDGRRTYDVVLEWLADPKFPVDELAIRTFPLERYAKALSAADRPPSRRGAKVAFRI